MDDEVVRRRIKAARALAGLDSAEELAGRLGMGARTVRAMESGERPVRPMELREIARICAVPYEWFTTDDLGAAVLYGDEKIRDPLGIPDAAAERLERIEAMLTEFRETWGELAAPAIGLIQAAAQERLDELEESEASHEATQPADHRQPQRRAV